MSRVLRLCAGFVRHLIPYHRPIAIAVQVALAVVANYLAFILRFDGVLTEEMQTVFWRGLPVILAVRALAFVPFRLHQGLWRYTSLYDLQGLVLAITTSSALFWVVTRTQLMPFGYPRTVIVIDAVILLVLLGGIRLSRRVYNELVYPRGGRRVLVVGAGDAGELIVRDMKNDADGAYSPVGFVDSDPKKLGRRIHGVPVLGGPDDLEKIIERSRPAEILIAIPSADPRTLQGLVRKLQQHKLPIKTLPHLRDIIGGRVQIRQIRDLAVEDLLSRAPVDLDRAPLQMLIAGRRVLVTGAGGSIGSELCRQIAEFSPARLVMLDQYENGLHQVAGELRGQGGSAFVPVIADVSDQRRMEQVFSAYRPEIVFHSAAHKHVPLMEENPCEAVKNNVRGTRIVAECAHRFEADGFTLISTDKAVNPTSVMGASKRLAELLVQGRSRSSGTVFSTVRFGNVLGSNGSVVPQFLEQIKRGGPVTVTHPEVRRYFMLIPEAVQLVLHAAARAENGLTYVLDMGDQIRVLDMAKTMIRLSGLIPDDDIRIDIVGLRPGEKLFEELAGADESAEPSKVSKVLQIRAGSMPTEGLMERVLRLEAEADAGRIESTVTGLFELIGAPLREATVAPGDRHVVH